MTAADLAELEQARAQACVFWEEAAKAAEAANARVRVALLGVEELDRQIAEARREIEAGIKALALLEGREQ